MLRRRTATAVLDALRAGAPMTATDLMNRTGLSRPTVHGVCNDLIRLGWISELDSRRPPGDSRPGRRARCYEFRARAGCVLGIDMGLRKVAVRLADLRGDPVAEVARNFRSVAIPAAERLARVRRASEAALSRGAVDPTHVLAVGLGVPTPVDAEGRLVGREAYLPGLPGRDLRRAVGRRFGWPVLVENDANLAALGERWRGVAAGVDDLVVMLASERIGSGLFLGGRPIRGHAGRAGEMRFLELIERVGDARGIACLVRTLGAEAVAGTTAGGAARARAGHLHDLVEGDPQRVRAETVFQAARAGDDVAVRIVDQVSTRMAHVIAAIATVLDPELVVIAGGVADAGDVFLDPIRRRLRPDLIDAPPRLAVSALGDEAVVVGAVRLALDFVESRLFGGSGPADWARAPA